MADTIGIMGGTFDPIHFGHLVAAEEARVRFGLSRVVFVPNGRPPHKKDYPVTPAEHRCQMVVLATAGNPAFETSRIEIDRPGPSYAIDTVRAFRSQLGPGTHLYFITGVDAIREVLTWREPRQLAQVCEFIAVTRPGCDLASLRDAVGGEIHPHIHVLDIPGLAVSSTELRRRAASGEPLRYLTPEPVLRYIAAHSLYAGGAPSAAAPARTTPTHDTPEG
jgi:nicotinate-nucleotide adenylyltransferase